MIDLNADIGESFGQYSLGNDEMILKFVSSVNIACGFHAGDPNVMHKTVTLSLKNGTAVGAHPGYPDLQGFGRRPMTLSPVEVYNLILYQVGALSAFVTAEGGTLQHVKPHGALYNDCAESMPLAESVVKAMLRINPNLILLGLPGSCLEKAATLHSVPFAREVFADRGYDDQGRLASRHLEGAIIVDEKTCIQRMLDMLDGKPVLSLTGKPLLLKGDTICLHGDHPESVAFAQALRTTLENKGHVIAPLHQLLRKS